MMKRKKKNTDVSKLDIKHLFVKDDIIPADLTYRKA